MYLFRSVFTQRLPLIIKDANGEFVFPYKLRTQPCNALERFVYNVFKSRMYFVKNKQWTQICGVPLEQ